MDISTNYNLHLREIYSFAFPQTVHSIPFYSIVPDSFGTTVSCYNHSLSPVKKANYSQKKYFNCNIQTEEGPVRAVCLNSEKRATLDKIGKGKAGVKLVNNQLFSRVNSPILNWKLRGRIFKEPHHFAWDV